MNFSIVIVSYKSSHLIDQHLQTISTNNEVIIIENSLDKKLKEATEKRYSNVKVIIPDKNLGFGAALNLGIKMSKNIFVMCLAADINFDKQYLLNIAIILNDFKEFTIISPTYFDERIHKNYSINKNKGIIKVSNFILKEVDELDGANLIINKKMLNSDVFFDENFFLYYENIDLCLRLRKKSHKLYAIENLKFNHLGAQSSHPSFDNEIIMCRNWHYCWSKFYFYKKHFSYFFAIRKTIPNLVRSIKYCIYFLYKKDDIKFKFHKSELLGLLNAYILQKSFYRPDIS